MDSSVEPARWDSEALQALEAGRLVLATALLLFAVAAGARLADLTGPAFVALAHLAAVLVLTRRSLPRVWPAVGWVLDLAALLLLARVLDGRLPWDIPLIASLRMLILLLVVASSVPLPVGLAVPLGLASGLAAAMAPHLLAGQPWSGPLDLLTVLPVVLVASAASLAAAPLRRALAIAHAGTADLAHQVAGLTSLTAHLARLRDLEPASADGLAAIAEVFGARAVTLLLYEPPDSPRYYGERARLHCYVGGRYESATVLAPFVQRASPSTLGCLPEAVSNPFDPASSGASGRVVMLSTSGALLGKLLVVGGLAERGGLADDLLAALASVLALNTERRSLERQVRSSLLATVESLVVGLEAKDPYTQGHSARVTDYAVRIAREMGLDDLAVQEIRLGGVLHDLGKIGIPDSILHKPGRLSPEEMAIVQEHPRTGARIIDSFNTSQTALDFVLFHHERHDGRGYPRGLAGLAIPLAARIGKVADSFDAMTSLRPYGTPRTFAEAAAELRACSGTHFDPDVVETFLRVLERDGPALEQSLRASEAAPAPANGHGQATPPEEAPSLQQMALLAGVTVSQGV